MKAELLLSQKDVLLGEGPVWDEKKGVLYWVDIDRKNLHYYAPKEDRDHCIKLSQKVGAVFLTPGDHVMLAMEDGIYVLSPGETPCLFAYTPEKDIPDNRLNDGKCDSKGQIWIGSVNMAGAQEKAALYRIDTEGKCETMLERVSISNGICWSHDNCYMYYIDTPSGFLWRFDFDPETARISNRTAIIDYRNERGHFDGMTIDNDGNLWIAHWGGFQVSCWNPNTGKKLDTIELPVPNVSCCTFGGSRMDQLFITTATEEDGNKKQYPLSGSLFCCQPGTSGSFACRFPLSL